MQRSFLLLLFTLVGCSTLPVNSALDRVQTGMDKAAVLDAAGNPKRTYRDRGEDHWIYVFFDKDRELSREVIFDAGKVTRVTRARAKADWNKEIEDASSGADAGFEPVNGSP